VDSKQLPAAVSVGYNVVFGGSEVSVEAHVLDFAGDLREREVAIDFVARIREEQNFESVEALVAQMHRDIGKVRQILSAAEEPGELLLTP
jgi:riboflavin kinase/FMN adenylyltransferase